LFSEEDCRAWQASPSQHLPSIQQALYRASGIPAAHRTLQDTLLRERGLSLLRLTREKLLRSVRGSANQQHRQAARMTEEVAELKRDFGAAQDRLNALHLQIEEQQRQHASLEQTRQQGEQELKRVLESELCGIREQTQQAVKRFAQEQASSCRDEGISIWKKHWKVELSQGRDELVKAFRRS